MLLPTVDVHRLLADLDFLARFGASAGGGVNRVAYSPEDLKARHWLEAQMRSLSLEVRTDQAGKSIGSYPGHNSRVPPVAIGSHMDTVPEGGRYDGALGVVAALACVRALHESEVRPQHPLEVIDFAAEKATMGGTIGERRTYDLLDSTMSYGLPSCPGPPIMTTTSVASGIALAADLEGQARPTGCW